MISINCPVEDWIEKYTDEAGKEHIIQHEAGDWDLNKYVDNGSKEGIKQRTHEEELLLGGEVVLKEAEWGVDWQMFFDKFACFTSNNAVEKNAIEAEFKRQIKEAITKIPNVISVEGVVIESVKNKVIKATAYFTYITQEQEAEVGISQLEV